MASLDAVPDFVMAGLVPAIHVFAAPEDVDAQDEPGHDDRCSLVKVLVSA